MMSSPNASAKWSKYGVEDGKLVRKAEFCPTCGPGVFLSLIHISEPTRPY